VLAIEAGRTILVDRDRLAEFAIAQGITIASVCDSGGEAALDSVRAAA
jgi:hypothetical protein